MAPPLPAEKLYRAGTIEATRSPGDGRRVTIAFSSEAPVSRYFGREILDHSAEAVRLDFFRSRRAPLLVDHDTSRPVGVIEEVSIGADRKGRVVARFGRGALAEEVFRDVVDGIRANVSVGYRIHRLQLETSDDAEGDTYRAVDWEPLEVSLVSIPADQTVGVGRATDSKPQSRAQPMEPTITPERAAKEAREGETSRIRSIQRLADYHRCPEIGREAIEKGWSYQEANDKMLAERESKPLPPPPPEWLDDSGRDGVASRFDRRYSVARAIAWLADPKSGPDAGFEREVSEEVARRTGRRPQGLMVPIGALGARPGAIDGQRILNVGTPTQGGNIVATDLLAGSFIELLRNRSAVMNAGATMLNGLVGNVDIPRQTSAATAYWLASETTAVTESTQAIDQVSMTPKTVGAYTQYTRNLLLQSSLDVEAFIRADLATVLALAIDRAALYGAGSSGEPLGLVGQPGLNMPLFGAPPSWAEMVGLETAVTSDNADVGTMGYLLGAELAGTLKTTPKESGYPVYILENGRMNDHPASVSNQVDATECFFGVWSQLLIGMWGGLDLTVDPYTSLTTRQVRVVAYQSVDVNVRHPQAFAYGTPATPSASV